MKLVGIITAIVGALLFLWHLVKVATGTDVERGITTHHVLSLVGGILVIVGTGIYISGRRRKRKHG